jgi:integrase
MARDKDTRGYLTRGEVASLLRAAKKSPHYGDRNYAMILLTYRHGLRANELVGLRVGDFDLGRKMIYCRRTKGSRSGVHRMKKDEVDAVKTVLRGRKVGATDHVFHSNRSKKIGRSAFWRIVSQTADRAGLPFVVDPHQLRQACGYHLSEKGFGLRLIQDYFGHKYIDHTMRYANPESGQNGGLMSGLGPKPGKLRKVSPVRQAAIASSEDTRGYLTQDELASLLDAAKKSPHYADRNYAMILLTYRHALRASELEDLRVGDLDLQKGTIHCRRIAGSRSGVHSMKKDEVDAVKTVLRGRKVGATDHVFHSNRSKKIGRSAFWKIVSQAGDRAGLPFVVDPHQLRQACGYHLSEKGFDLRQIQDYFGHRYIQNTMRYANLDPARTKKLW